MDRRRFLLTSLAGAAASPLAAIAQQAEKVPRIGFVRADRRAHSIRHPYGMVATTG
jgi:hypothetical protein